MSRVKGFSEWLTEEADTPTELNESLRGISAAVAGAIVVAQANRIRMHLSQVRAAHTPLETKIEAIAAALDAFNTKTTAMAALQYGLSR